MLEIQHGFFLLRIPIQPHETALGQPSEQQFVGQRAAQFVLNQAAHRARAHLRVEAFFGQIGTQGGGKLGLHLFRQKLLFELQQEFIDDAGDDRAVQRCEGDDCVQAVAEFRREGFVYRLHLVAALVPSGKAEARPAQAFRTGIGGHNQHHVAEIRAFAVVVGQPARIHNLQQDVEDVGVGFFDFIQE